MLVTDDSVHDVVRRAMSNEDAVRVAIDDRRKAGWTRSAGRVTARSRRAATQAG